MSLFGGIKSSINILGIPSGVSSGLSTIDITRLLLGLFDVIETIENTLLGAFLEKDQLAITPEMAFKDVKIRGNYAPLLARRVYYQNGFSNLANGTCDCRILEQLYREHPILRLYSFEIAEPKCCE